MVDWILLEENSFFHYSFIVILMDDKVFLMQLNTTFTNMLSPSIDMYAFSIVHTHLEN